MKKNFFKKGIPGLAQIILLLAILGLAGAAPLRADEFFRRIWTDQQLPLPAGWFRHKEGHAFSMAAGTYVFPIGQTLPPGKYVIWLLPYYKDRQPLSIKLDDQFQPMQKRYFRGGWYGGNVILAGQPFSTITLDFSGVKNGINGIALSNNPDDGFLRGVILRAELAAQQSSAGVRNLFRGSSFETGAGYGYASNVKPADLTDGAWHGQVCLKTSLVSTRWFGLSPGLPHILSFYVKTGAPASLEATVSGPRETEGASKSYGKRWEVSEAGKWQRYSLEFTPEETLGNLYRVVIRTRDAQPFYVDAIQLEQGAVLSPYQPRSDLELGFRSRTLGNVYRAGQSKGLDIYAFNNTAADTEAAFQLLTYDFYGRPAGRKSLTWKVPPGTHRFDYTEPAAATGLFRAELRSAAGQLLDEIVYSVLPARPFAADVRYPEDGTLGTDSNPFLAEYLLAANRHWMINKHLGQLVFSTSYSFKFGVTPPDWEKPRPWLEITRESPVRVLATMGNYGAFKVSDYGSMEGFLQAYGEHLLQTARFFKPGRVEHFEIWNEPYYTFKAEEYLELLKTGYRAVKAGNPEAKVVGICGQTSWTGRLLELGAADYCDIISNHFYDNPRESMKEYGELVKKYNKEAWNTETSGRCFSSYRSIPTLESVFADDPAAHFEEINRRENIPAALDRLKNYLYSITLARCRRYFTYVSRFNGDLADLHNTSSFGNTEWDGGWKATGVVQNIASFFLDGHTFRQEIPFAPDIESLHLVSRRNENLLVAWVRGPESYRLRLPSELKAGLHIHGMLGNEFPDPDSMLLDQYPVYLRSNLEPAAFARLVGQIKVERIASPGPETNRKSCLVELESSAGAF
ncbi:MAG TPA: hypothetical protein PKN80_06905, partial [bacterium]|nr:hypothetical protein [bacterium]